MGIRILARIIGIIIFAIVNFFIGSVRAGDNEQITGYSQYDKTRNNYVKKHRKFMRIANNGYHLFNDNLYCEYSPNTFTFKFTNKKDETQTSTVVPVDNFQNKTNMTVFLDSIFYNFNENLTYEALYARVSRNQMFRVIGKFSKGVQPSNNNSQPKTYEEPQERVNINMASEEELAKLPGINIIKAKKIVQHRNLHGGFKSVNEFLRFVNPKSHFETLIRANVYLGRRIEKNDDDSDNNNNERIVDLE